MKYPKVLSVKAIEDYKLILIFENQEVKCFDVKPYIKGKWFGELKDVNLFRCVKPNGNTIEWINGQDIAPHDLYENSKYM